MKSILRRLLKQAASPQRWRAARKQQAEMCDPVEWAYPRPRPMAILVVGPEEESLRVAGALAAETLRPHGGARIVEATSEGDADRDAQAAEIAQAVDNRFHLVAVLRYSSDDAYRALTLLLADHGYQTGTVMVAASAARRDNAALRPYAEALRLAYDHLQSATQLVWLAPGKPQTTRRANRLGEKALELLGVTASPPLGTLPDAGAAPDPMMRQRLEFLQILRRRAALEQVALAE